MPDTLNERAAAYEKQKPPWWPKCLRYDKGIDMWFLPLNYSLKPDEAHALIGWSLMVWMADEGHLPALSGLEGEYFVITPDVPREDGPADSPLAALFNALDAIKEAE